jgi:enoyl-CoA hydratase
VAEIVLDRPQKLNAVTPEMAARLTEFCARVDQDDSVRAVLLRAVGERAFSAGSDLNSLAQYPSALELPQSRRICRVGA